MSAPQVVVPGRILRPGVVAVSRGLIVGVQQGRSFDGRRADLVLRDGLLAPGLVDLQVNGCFGVDLVHARAAAWARVVQRLPETGVTAFMPTFISASVDSLAGALGKAAKTLRRLPPGARVLGLHLEGPFLSERYAGAHDARWFRDPDEDSVGALLAAAPGLLRIVTLAPERDGAIPAVERLTEAGVVVSLGHSGATSRQAARAVDAGARMVTHLFNAQRPLHHREPGLVGQALGDARLTSGLIADLHHVSAPVVKLAFAAAPGRIALVSDAVAAAGMPPGEYRLGGRVVDASDGGPARLNDGTIAGSTLRLDRAVANAVAAGVDLLTAMEAATRVPADLVGRRDLGRIVVGAAADLVWLSEDLEAVATWVGGERVQGGDRR